MNTMLVALLAGLCAALLVWGMLRRGRIYEFPFLAAAVFAGWVLPQAIGLINDPFLPPEGLEMTLIMSILCLGAGCLGYRWEAPAAFWPRWTLDPSRLLIGSAVLTLVGGAFYLALSRLPQDQISATQFEGTPVAYLFFADNLSYGFALALILFFRTNSRLALAIALAGSAFYLERIVLSGRRGDVVQVILMVLCAAWFQRRKTISTPVMIAGVIAGALIFNNIDQYRAIVLDDSGRDWSKISEIDFVGGVSTLAEEGGEELKAAVYSIAATESELAFDFGLFHWNTLVFNYVPAQIVGPELKAFLTVDLPQPALTTFGYTANVGATLTGMSDAFGSFWYFGALKFFVIGWMMAIMFRAAMLGDVTAQIFYMVMAPNALHTITHHTQWFVSPWVHMVIFLCPVLYLARAAGGARAARI